MMTISPHSQDDIEPMRKVASVQLNSLGILHIYTAANGSNSFDPLYLEACGYAAWKFRKRSFYVGSIAEVGSRLQSVTQKAPMMEPFVFS